MKSTYKIIWTEEAINGLKDTVNYLEQRWTQKELNSFSRLLDKQLIIIKTNPGIFPFSNKNKGIRKSVLSGQTSIYYKTEGHSIYLLSVFNNRQDPGKLKFNK